MVEKSEPEKAVTSAPAAAAPAAAVNATPLPAELDGWNWGAFLLSWIWGIGHSVWISFLVFASIVPVIGWVISIGTMIYLGMKGNELAWQHRKFESVEQFKAVQAAWTKWGVIIFVISLVLGLIMTVLLGGFIMTMFSSAATTSTTTSF